MKKSAILAICLVICMSIITKAQNVGDGFDKKYQAAEGKNETTAQPGVDVSFNFLDAPLMDILWCGANKSTIFVLSEKSTMYRSTNDGFNGHKLTDHLEKLGQKELEGTNQEVGTVSRMVPSPVDPNLILFLGTEGINWITQDCGDSIKAMNQGRRVEEIQFHPTERNWMLAYAWTVCEDFVDEPCKKYKELFLTKDLGESWEYLANYVYQFSWGMPDALNFKIPKERVIIAHEPHARGHQNFGDWSEKLYVSYSDDFFNHSDILVKGGNKFLLTQNFLFVVQVIDEDEDEVVLLVGNSRERKYKHLRPIDLPVKHLREHSYTILDTSEHAVFLHINHEGEKSKFGNIYVSDSTGQRFNLALQGNVRDVDGQCDFERVQGLEGIYLANIYDKETLSRHKSSDTSSMSVQGPGSKKTIEAEPGRAKPTSSGSVYGSKSFSQSLDDFKQTVVSFDKGGMWKFLTAPDRDSNGKRITCDDERCHLHLHSISDPVFGPFYSTSNSMGLILGTGNVGEYLSNKADETNTYLSRDGGRTWNEIAKGSHIYDIGDHGSIIVIAPDQYATTDIQYSWDEGLTWDTLTISDEPVEIRNIIIEPSNTAEKFIIYGRTTQSPRKGFMAAIDFSPLHKRWCQGIEHPDTPESDYETWTPNGFVSAHCLLGRRINYIRKKRDAQCFNSEEHERWSIQEFCECTEEDWECDYGFFRKELASGCVSQDGKEVNTTAPEECPDYYYITQGYRKIAGDSCVGGISHEPIKVSCPGGPLGSSNLLVFALLVSIVLGLVWVNKKGNYDRLKDGFAEVVNTVLRSINKKAGPHSTGSGWVPIREYPDQGKDDDDLNHIVFEENEENPEVIEDNKLLEVAKGKKKAEGGLKAATKQVPLLNKPSSKHTNEDLGV